VELTHELNTDHPNISPLRQLNHTVTLLSAILLKMHINIVQVSTGVHPLTFPNPFPLCSLSYTDLAYLFPAISSILPPTTYTVCTFSHIHDFFHISYIIINVLLALCQQVFFYLFLFFYFFIFIYPFSHTLTYYFIFPISCHYCKTIWSQ
jgi:hypothetical protein